MQEMERNSIGGSGVEISRIGLGGYELGPEPDEEPDAERAAGVMRTAIDCGVNWLDTSENYLATHNEEVIGEALQLVGGDFLVASKVAPEPAITGGGSGFRREEVLQACRDSLTRLRRDHLDVYFLHWPDERGVPLEETWGAIAELVDAGLVRAIGLSNYELDDVVRCHRQRPVDAVQVGLSLIDYLEDRPYIASCGDLGIAVTIYEPLAGGILTGKSIRSEQHTRDNAGAARLALSAELLERIEELIPLGPTQPARA
jgi:aryl-alcohol dehydrogenase-like predicted oxidoreductase